LRLSLQDCGESGADAGTSAGQADVDDELAEAIRLSMAQPEPQQQEQSGVAAEAAGTPSGAGSQVQQLVKELFAEYTKQGLNPNDAAAKAMAEAKARAGKGGCSADATSMSVATEARSPQEVVKELFEEYRRQGVPPNEAAAKAVAEAKKRSAS